MLPHLPPTQSNTTPDLGPFASAFLYGTSLSSKIQPAEPPPNWTPNTNQFKSNPAAYQLYTALHTHTLTAIFPNANKNWSTATNSTGYSSTYHTHTPSQWGTQALTLNISIGIADHIKTHMSLHRTHRFHQRRITKLATDKQQCPYSRPLVCFLLPRYNVP